jgi:hypothetical protein
MDLKGKLILIQNDLKAPKNQYNSFGKYKYRSCEDILEGLKPVLKKHNTSLKISDDIVLVGERYYIKATVTLMDTESGEIIENTAYARESDDKKGMDASQVTGATSSYARKYALNGMFLIDDTKDADTDEFQGKVRGESADDIKQNNEWMAQGKDLIDETKVKSLQKVCKNHNLQEEKLAQRYSKKKLSELTINDYLDFTKTGESLLKKWDEEHAG